MGKVNFHVIGVIGVVDFVILSAIVLFRWGMYLVDCFVWKRTQSRNQKHLLFALLLLASVCDIPLYESFMVQSDYSIAAYSFHKFESAAIFGAYSLVISDWTRVLFKIREGTIIPFMFRNITLIFINAVLVIISIVNFGICYSAESLQHYANSNAYVVGLFVQIVAPFLLTCIMLHAGIKLYLRIYGASRKINSGTDNAESREFASALFRLIIVMISVGLVIFVQVTLVALNFIFSYHTEADETPGPAVLYYMLTEFVPLSVLTIALLFLTRTKPTKSSGFKTNSQLPTPSNTTSESLNNKPVMIGTIQSLTYPPNPEPFAKENDSPLSPLLRNSDEQDDVSGLSYDEYSKIGQFRTNTYEYAPSDESNNFRTSDITNSHLRISNSLYAFHQGGGFRASSMSNTTSDTGSKYEDIMKAYRPSIDPKR